MNRELLKVKIERDGLRERLEKVVKKLESKKALEAEVKGLKEAKARCEEEVRQLHKERASDKEKYFVLSEEKIKLQS